MLKIVNLNAYYGRIQALNSVALDVKEGEIISLVGANGAGKSGFRLACVVKSLLFTLLFANDIRRIVEGFVDCLGYIAPKDKREDRKQVIFLNVTESCMKHVKKRIRRMCKDSSGLTKAEQDGILLPAGKTEAGSAEEPARDSRPGNVGCPSG